MLDEKDLQAKSDQMNAVDFVRPMLFRIIKVEYNPKQDQPIKLHLQGYDGRPYKPCKSMLRGLAQAWGMEEQEWNNRLIELYCDPEVKWAGVATGGIRISALSAISKPVEFTVQLNKSQRKIHTFNVLSDDQPVKKEYIETHWQDAINECESNQEITDVMAMAVKQFGAEQIEGLRDTVTAARDKFKAA